jgi:hypothetical protein
MSESSIAEIMQVGLGFWASKTLLTAVEIGLFTELAKRPEDLPTLQGTLGLHPRSLHRHSRFSPCLKKLRESGEERQMGCVLRLCGHSAPAT